METVTPVDSKISATRFADLILDISTILLESGAHCERINRNVQRIAAKTHFEVEMLLSFTAVSVTISNRNNPLDVITVNRRVRHHGAHFGVLTHTSLLTWDFFDDKIAIEELEAHLHKLKNIPKHSIWLVRFFIGIACGCLCLLVGGDFLDGTFAFSASFLGLIARQEIVKKGFNVMIAVVCSAFITTTVSGSNVLLQLGTSPETSVATAVLFLIPGVPLINCIIDLLEGYIPTALARGAFGGFILLCIAVGMFLSMALIGINNF